MDDFRGRAAAQQTGLEMIGATGLLLTKQFSAVTAIRPVLLALRVAHVDH